MVNEEGFFSRGGSLVPSVMVNMNKTFQKDKNANCYVEYNGSSGPPIPTCAYICTIRVQGVKLAYKDHLSVSEVVYQDRCMLSNTGGL